MTGGDHQLHGIVHGAELRVIWVEATAAVREAARLHGTLPTATSALAQLCVGALLAGGLGKDAQRVTLQVSGRGPLRTQFAEGTASGRLRAFVGAPGVAPAPGRDRDDLVQSFGAGAQFSVLRELEDGELYRGLLELPDGRMSHALTAYFDRSEQVPTAVAIDVRLTDEGEVTSARGLLVQRLPGGDEAAIASLRAAFDAGALRATEPGNGAMPRLAVLPELEVLARNPIEYRCNCSRDRAEGGLLAAGRDELLDMIARDHGASLTCEFCRTVYAFDAAQLCALVDRHEADGR